MPEDNENISVEEAIEAAMNTPSGEEGEETEEVSEEIEQSEEDSEEEESEESSEKEEIPEETSRALEVYKGLTGPNANAIFKDLARKAGIKLAEDFEQDDEEEEEYDSGDDFNIEEFASKELGQYSFLAKPVAAIAQKILAIQESKVNEKVSRITTDLSDKEAISTQKGIITKFASEKGIDLDISKDQVSKTLYNNIQQFPYSGPLDKYDAYLGRMYRLSLSDLGKSAPTKQNNSDKADKIRKNLASREPEAAGNREPEKGPRKMKRPDVFTAEEAVAAALEGVEIE